MKLKNTIVSALVVSLGLLAGCVSTGGTKSDKPLLPVFTPQTVVKQPGLVVQIGRLFESASFPFESVSSAENDMNEDARDKHQADALVIVSREKAKNPTYKNDTLIHGDAVKFIPATPENILKELSHPSYVVKFTYNWPDRVYYTYQVESALYHAGKNPRPEYADAASRVILDKKISETIRARYAAYLTRTDKGRHYDTYLAVVSSDVCQKCIATLGQAFVEYSNAKYGKQYLDILKNGRNAFAQQLAAEALAKTGGKKYIPEWTKILKFHKDTDVRLTAAKTLLKYGHRKEVEKVYYAESDARFKADLEKILL